MAKKLIWSVEVRSPGQTFIDNLMIIADDPETALEKSRKVVTERYGKEAEDYMVIKLEAAGAIDA